MGILCVTRENLSAPWLMFEAGALAKSLDQSRVIPLLIGVEPADLSGPLTQFQAARFDRPDVRRLLSVINAQLGSEALEETVLASVFEKWWPDLETKITSIIHTLISSGTKSARTDREILEEILELMRDRVFRSVRLQGTTLRQGDVLSRPIDELLITARTANILKAESIYTIGDLIDHSENQLLKTPNMGRKTLNEIKEVLAAIDIELKGNGEVS